MYFPNIYSPSVQGRRSMGSLTQAAKSASKMGTQDFMNAGQEQASVPERR